MFIYRAGCEPGAALDITPDYARTQKYGWRIQGDIQLRKNASGGRFLSVKEGELLEFVAGDFRDWVVASTRSAFEEFVGLTLTGYCSDSCTGEENKT